MASMNPNPFPIPVKNFGPTAIAPTELAATPAFAPPPAAPAIVPPAPAPSPSTAPSTTDGRTAWTESTPPAVVKTPSPDSSGSIRMALQKLRRAQLTRLVKAVVIASWLVCVAAVGRVAFSAITREPEPHVAAPAMREHDGPAHATVQSGVDSLSARTLEAMTGAAPRAPAHKAKHALASRSHRRW